MSSNPARDEEPEFGLQRAETGDRRIAQNSQAQNNGASDLRAAHSSDFFSGQRERGRDETSGTPRPSAPARQSFRRPTSPQPSPTASTTQYTTTQPPPPSPSKQQPFEGSSKRKLVRKRPVYVSTTISTPAPTTFAQSTPSQRQYFIKQEKSYSPTPTPEDRPRVTAPANIPPQFKEYKDEYVEVPRVTPKQTNRYYPSSPSPTPFSQSTPAPRFNKKEGLAELYNYESQPNPGFNGNNNRGAAFRVRNNINVSPEPQEQDFSRKNINVIPNGARSPSSTPDYNGSSRSQVSTTPAYRNFNSVSYEPEKNNFNQNQNYPTAKQNYFNSPTTQSTSATYTTTRSDAQNFNTVAHNTNIGFNAQQINYSESEEDDGQYRLPPGEDDGQYRPEQYERERELLSGAHSLNIAASGNRLPDDQKPRHKPQQAQTAAPRPFRPAPTAPSTTYAPEPTYTTTFAPQTASTQRIFDLYQTYTTTARPTEKPELPKYSQNYEPSRQSTAKPTPQQYSQTYEPTRQATVKPTPPQFSQTYEPVRQSTLKPTVPQYSQNYEPVRQSTTTLPPRSLEPRPQTTKVPSPPPTALHSRPTATTPRPNAPAAQPAAPTTRQPHFARPAGEKEDNSYDYAYYDSDPGFSEYDNIEEFGKTKTKKT